MDPADIRKNYALIRAAANDVLTLFGPGFTNKPEGHVETDISAAASLSGVSILWGKGFDMNAFRPGTMIFTELDSGMNDIWNFMTAAAQHMGLEPSTGWDGEIPEANKPLCSIPEMIQKTERKFLAICGKHHLKKEFFPYVAVLAALKFVYAAHTLQVLDQDIGKALTGYHVVAGAKTVPYPQEQA